MAYTTFLFSLIIFLLFINVSVYSASVKKHQAKPAKTGNSNEANNQGGNAAQKAVTKKPPVSEEKKDQESNDISEKENDQDEGEPRDDNQTKRPRGFRGGVVMLAQHPDCADDISRLCHEIDQGNNFDILVCIQDKAKEDDISKECHNLLWSYKKNLTCDGRFDDTAKKMCKSDIEKNPYCKKQGERSGHGHLIPCLLETRQNISDTRCHHLLTKMQAIVFSNYHLIEGFFEHCHDDVTSVGCGRITAKDDDEDIHDQNEVLECLEDHQDKLSSSCQKQIFRMAELSADDYHLDRPLYYACRDDREKFCHDVPAGEGKVYKCLKDHKFEETMSKECQAALTVRQKVESQDYKADYGLLKNCEADIERYKDEYKCDVGAKSPHGSLAGVLLCLEEAVNDGKPVDNQCQSELFEIRRQLMEDYKINPEVVLHCEAEIEKHCNQGKEREGKTLDCLMKLGEEQKLGKKCEKAVVTLLKETRAGGDYRIDHTLYMACEPVVQTTCKDKGKKEGDVMVLSCLMEHLNSDVMNHECREQLLHLQFFVSRDFRLDPDLYQACKKDAKDYCHAPSWSEESEDLPSGMIVSCLYRNSGQGGKVSPDCSQHVRRVMHQRALDVHLIPEVQESCMPELAKYCSENVEKGQEVECLQNHLEELGARCKSVIGNFTEEEGEDYQLDQTLVRMCTGMVTKFCEDVVNQGDTEGVLPCLIEHKTDLEMDEKCRASIEHWQLIELKDFRFSAKFKKACRGDAEKHCRDAKDKHDVIKCLSKLVRDAVINEESHKISDQCRAELHVAEKEEGENIHFDPELFGACGPDAKKLCGHVTAGQAKVLECLKDNFDSLQEKCQEQIFEREKKEMQMPDIDFQLVKTCQRAIEHFCSNVEPNDILKCLKEHKHEPKMDPKCRSMVTKRQKTQYKDVQLDPELQGACKRDMKKFCKNVKHGEGQMVGCLKKHLERLSEDCEAYVRSVMHEEALDYRLDPVLSKACQVEVRSLCSDIDPGRGKVEECLRNNLGKIQVNNKCYTEVIRTMKEGKTDIYADPVLYEACVTDVTHYCEDVPPGHGRVMQCLLEIKNKKKYRLSRTCNSILNVRMRMWNVGKVAQFETLSDVALSISASPSKNYFLMVIAIALALIFLGGLVFGRVSKRVKREIKDR